MNTLLQADQVTKRYGNGRGVREVSLEISRGDIFGLIGPNGAGKTTLLKMLVGLARPDSGTIRLFGHSLADRFERAMAGVGCLIETADAYEYMSAYDNLKLAARFYPDLPKTRIEEALEQVGLAPYRKEKVAGYSLGMKQRLALASALLSRPELVVLDEPANGLDVEGMADVRRTVTRLSRDQGITFLISSHLIHDLGMIASRIGIMKDGSLIRQGAARDLLPDGHSLEDYVLAELRTAKEAV
ncbi:ATP-binding cassette domain-containing protein [Cohnella sp. CFH 77786]|uniref:ABC transporter ATP-binding protein n=1 Tax=Cohnella sp. CFH 77786 TaxID=2662265 RepID=UPI001C61043F|nr:ABC transporter ATP-binding protein [Cohnella sp. CFH 77786]MBW5448004.1 ATP-binding cassette domain-containing protein [Cohnella sp. CFH 77786]